MNGPTHPHAPQVVVAAWLVVAAWCVLAFLVAQFSLAQIQALRGTWPFEASVTAVLLAVFVGLAIAYLAFAIIIRCEFCGKRLFLEVPGPKHPRASRVWGMDHWASSVVNVLRHGQCTCMYCGSVAKVRG